MIYLVTTFDNNRRIIPNKSIVLQVRTGTILKNTVWTLNVGYACTLNRILDIYLSGLFGLHVLKFT